MRCGCVPRLFRRATRTCPVLSAVDAFLPKAESDNALPSPTTASQNSLPQTEDTRAELLKSDLEPEAAEEEQEDVPSTADMTDGSVGSGTAPEAEEGEEGKAMGLISSAGDKDSSIAAAEKTKRSGAPFFRNFFKRLSSSDEMASVWIRCEMDFVVVDEKEMVLVSFRYEDDHATAAAVVVSGSHHRLTKIATMPTAATIQSLFRIMGRKQRDEADMQDLIRAHHPSGTSVKTENSEEDENSVEVSSRPKEQRSMFCFGWGQTAGALNDDDEAITPSECSVPLTETPPGLVGLLNLGNTCFLNAALQCLRCTPGFVSLVVPELKDAFEGVVMTTADKQGRLLLESLPGKENQAPAMDCASFNVGNSSHGGGSGGRLQNRSHTSSSFLYPRSNVDSEWECVLTLRSSSLPMPLPQEIAGRLEGETGLAGGAVLRLSSVPNLARLLNVSMASPNNSNNEEDDDDTRVSKNCTTASNKALDEERQQQQNGSSISCDDIVDDEEKKNWEVIAESASSNAMPHEEENVVGASFSPSRAIEESTRDPPMEKKTGNGDQEKDKSPPKESTQITNDSHYHDSATSASAEDKTCGTTTTTAAATTRRTDGAEASIASTASTSTQTETAVEKNLPVAEGEATESSSEIELSENFIAAFQKLVLDVCLGDPEKHRSPRDLYLQLKKLPQGEWFCDGGQHDCQEIFKVLLDAIHANYTVQCIATKAEMCFGRCLSDVSEDVRLELDETEMENLKANSMWRSYLSKDCSPVTDIFAGQLQIVRTCQKCQSRSTTYEPFWDLSLSLSKEKSSWFNPNRVPSSLDDLLRAFTAAEVLEGDEAPYCDCCEQKCPATRRILIHRFPKVLVINIKRFKYTKDGREKLTSNVAFPIHSLRLQSFASKEHQYEGIDEIYDLYAVSNHYGTLGGGHYTAFCKVRDGCGSSGWYSFNDKKVTKLNRDAIATPNAYILFYAKRDHHHQHHHHRSDGI